MQAQFVRRLRNYLKRMWAQIDKISIRMLSIPCIGIVYARFCCVKYDGEGAIKGI